MRITNNTAVVLMISDIKDQLNVIAASTYKDFVVTNDVENSYAAGDLKRLEQAGTVSVTPVTDTQNGVDTLDVVAWAMAHDTKAVYPTDATVALTAMPTTVQLSIQDTNSITDTLNSYATVTITSTASARTSGISYLKRDGTYTTVATALVTAGLVVPVINGVATVKLYAGTLQAVDTITLSTTATSQSGLTKSDTYVQTAS